jgi:hypothetical protein
VAWLSGSVLWCSAVALGIFRFRRLLRSAQSAPDELRDRIERMARRLDLRRIPMCLVVPARVPPMLWALIGPPRIILPGELWSSLNDDERDAILAHELAHLKRHDEWARRLEAVALGLYWWNPVAWWARREVERAEEQCCDAWVLWALPGAGSAYARALVRTADFLSQSESRPSWPVGASGAGHFPPLKRRLTMILNSSTHGVNPTPRSASHLVLILAGLSLLLLPAWALSEPPKVEDAKPVVQETSKPAAKSPALDAPPEIADKVKFAQVTTGEVRNYQMFTGNLAEADFVQISAPRRGTVKALHPFGTLVEKGDPIGEYTSEDHITPVGEHPSENRIKPGEARAIAKPDRQIRSPRRGVVSFANGSSDGTSNVEKFEPFALIRPTDSMLVDFHLDQTTFLKLRRQKIATGKKSALDVGSPVEVMVGGDSGRYRGQMVAVEKTFDSKSHTLHCRASMPNPDGLFIPGMSASVEIAVGAPHKAPWFPAEATLPNLAGGMLGSLPIMIINSHNIIEFKSVDFVQRYAGKYEVVDGLQEGDWVVVAGQELVKPGMKVKR